MNLNKGRIHHRVFRRLPSTRRPLAANQEDGDSLFAGCSSAVSFFTTGALSGMNSCGSSTEMLLAEGPGRASIGLAASPLTILGDPVGGLHVVRIHVRPEGRIVSRALLDDLRLGPILRGGVLDVDGVRTTSVRLALFDVLRVRGSREQFDPESCDCDRQPSQFDRRIQPQSTDKTVDVNAPSQS
ncbi:hypothetical protein EYF80_022566 [Liparis tanakae]|uniref:Uncharacterized protein n=1 Tax=Liparis tanakae TaxID=230148 RepID=A0A4Z2HN03_9TELE|nr:hypothetical protein EYF80_022566 [Liparis tanakae]